MRPGLYRLTRDVKNPAPDRRSTSFNKLAVWPKGMRVVAVARFAEEGGASVTECDADYLFRFGQFESNGVPVRIRPGPGPALLNPVFMLLAEAMELEPRSLDSVLRREPSLRQRQLLTRLLDAKKITLDDIEEAL
ncbi:MAG: hypothetical protein WC986_14640 [Elusimicrobiota bacterium]|jgi:hypothetical protein